jgi:hypothetical protein
VTISEKFIDEFEDVSHEEKLFMKLWNRHMRKPTIFADAQVRAKHARAQFLMPHHEVNWANVQRVRPERSWRSRRRSNATFSEQNTELSSASPCVLVDVLPCGRTPSIEVPGACHHFAVRQGPTLHAHGLRYNFLLHLLNLWDNSLLAAAHISSCMAIVDAHASAAVGAAHGLGKAPAVAGVEAAEAEAVSP